MTDPRARDRGVPEGRADGHGAHVSTPVEAGEFELSVTVTVTYRAS